MQLNKDRVRLRFARAAGTYDQQAVVQLQVAKKLLQLLDKHVTLPPEKILEIGCCTGLLSSRLYQQYQDMKTLYVNDLVPDFQTMVSDRLENDQRLVYLPGDIEQIKIPGDLDLVVSSSTLHWLEDLPAMFKKLEHSLVPGGSFCFSIYGIENLLEVRELTGVGLDYYDITELQTLVEKHFDILSCTEEKIALHFDDPLSILNHLRQTGVNAIDQLPWTRSRLNHFLQKYRDRFNYGEQVELTYHPIYCIARKKS